MLNLRHGLEMNELYRDSMKIVRASAIFDTL
jgi:hypothetical protein